ncbi:MAG: hypothetical protein ACK47B_25885 [Armatimonadota bacterium]
MRLALLLLSPLVLGLGLTASGADDLPVEPAPRLPPIRAEALPEPEQAAKNENFSPALVYGLPRPDGSRRAEWRANLVGKTVQVEGLALGEPPLQENHMTTQRVAYEGGRIFVRGADFPELAAVGKPVRVKGTLRLVPESETRWGPVEKYYYLEARSVEVLERVTDPLLASPEL